MSETYQVIITLSSDDEEAVPPSAPPVKKAKLTKITNGVHGKNATATCIIQSDDEETVPPTAPPAKRAKLTAVTNVVPGKNATTTCIIQSDDEETVPPPTPHIKIAELTAITNSVAGKNATTSCIIQSDDEETVPPPTPPVKIAKLTAVTNAVADTNVTTSCIILSDDDDDVLINADTTAETSKSNLVSKTEENSANPCNVETVDIAIEDSKPAEAPKDQAETEIEQTEEITEAATPNGITDQPISAENNTISENGATNSNSANIETKLFSFLDECLKTVKKPRHVKQLSEKLPIIKRYLNKLVEFEVDFVGLEEIIKNTKDQLGDTEKAVMCFIEIFQWMKLTGKSVEAEQINSGQNDVKTNKYIKRLEVTLFRIQRKIKKLEEAEVDFDDEENSHYIQTGRYKDRAMQIYKKLCQYKKEKPNTGLLHYRLDFSASKHTEINHAINKKYKNNMSFPTYFDLDKCIRKCVEVKQLPISEENLQHEIRYCFEVLGNLLQKRRKMDLLHCHQDYLAAGTSKDPATEDPTLDCKLRANRLEANTKIDDIVKRYVLLQETGVDPEVSSDSEDSVVVDSDRESEENL